MASRSGRAVWRACRVALGVRAGPAFPCEAARDVRRGGARRARHRRRTGGCRGSGGARGAACLGGDPGVGHRRRDSHRLGRCGRGDGLDCRRPGLQVHDPSQAVEGKRRSQPLTGHRRACRHRGVLRPPRRRPVHRIRPRRLRVRALAGRCSNGLAFDEGRPARRSVSRWSSSSGPSCWPRRCGSSG